MPVIGSYGPVNKESPPVIGSYGPVNKESRLRDAPSVNGNAIIGSSNPVNAKLKTSVTLVTYPQKQSMKKGSKRLSRLLLSSNGNRLAKAEIRGPQLVSLVPKNGYKQIHGSHLVSLVPRNGPKQIHGSKISANPRSKKIQKFGMVKKIFFRGPTSKKRKFRKNPNQKKKKEVKWK